MTDLLGFSDEYIIDTIIGLETGSERLIKKYMEGKAKPYNPDNWHDLALEGINILNENNWYPMCSLIAGLPDETEEDVIKTLNLVDELKGNRLFYYIFYFVPMGKLEDKNFFSINEITERRWELFYTCWMETIKSMRVYLKSYKNKFLASLILRIIYEIEKDLKKYKNHPTGFQDTYRSMNLKGIQFLSFLAKRFIS